MLDPYGGYRERKRKRTEWFFKYIFKKKLVTCTACNGSGYYDNTVNGRTPKCSSCDGTGKERED
jgi:DnaJ-class molecular chaperone